MYCLIKWHCDGKYSVIRCNSIQKPRKEEEEYVINETVEAKWEGQLLKADIVEFNSKYDVLVIHVTILQYDR